MQSNSMTQVFPHQREKVVVSGNNWGLQYQNLAYLLEILQKRYDL